MIKECNFKIDGVKAKGIYCGLQTLRGIMKHCSGEDNCILYQIYKQLQPKGLTGFDRIKEDRF